MIEMLTRIADQSEREEFYRLLQRHNDRIGTKLQLLIQNILLRYMIGPVISFLLTLLFKIEIRGKERLACIGDRALFAGQHYFEWDPFVYCSLLWRPSLRKPHLIPQSIASPIWTRTPFRRTLCWLLGVMGVVKGREPHAGAIRRAACLLNGTMPATIGIFPTGPIGKTKSYSLYPGVAHLAMRCPQVPVVPISLIGIADVDLRSILTLNRPRVQIVVGEPFTAQEIGLDNEQALAAAICDRIDAEWRKSSSSN